MAEILRTIRIGTRGSPLALAQVELVKAALAEHCPDVDVEVKVIKTSGDWHPSHGERALAASEGGKGLFAKEIEKALLSAEIDAAVHSMKDMDSHPPEGLFIDYMLPREDPRDALLLRERGLGDTLDILNEKAVVGAASVRRAAFIKNLRPDLNIVPIRGNVQTRIDKLRGENQIPGLDCTFLAMAGLNRLNIAKEADVVLEPEVMLPSAGQGAVGIQLRCDDAEAVAIFSQISDLKTVLCVKAERAALKVVDGSCHTPIGAYAVLDDGEIWLRVRVCSLDGRESYADEIRGSVTNIEEAEALGREIGMRLKERVPADILGVE